jgi:hypothetical protein
VAAEEDVLIEEETDAEATTDARGHFISIS